MNSVLLLFASIASSIPFGNSMRVTAHVKDTDGNPAVGVTVRVQTYKNTLKGLGREPGYTHYEGVTDTNGEATLSFQNYSSHFNMQVYSDNYYMESTNYVYIKFIQHPDLSITLTEHSKDISFILREKKNPIPMYASSTPLELKLPSTKGFWGFDLKVHDWISPYGKGKVADFSIEYSEKSMANGLFSCTGAVIFAGLDGAYVMKKKKSKAFWSVHEADTNAIYAQHFPFYYFPAEDGSRLEHRHDTINEDEYLVLRTRVKTDPSGKIKSANYSKIYGPILVGRGFRFRESCFNPTPNDPNIEFDVKRNLFKKPHGTLLP